MADMKDRKIAWIVGLESPREGELPSMYRVGWDGVTVIDAVVENYGDHGLSWFYVWQGEHLYAAMSARVVAEVRFMGIDEKEAP